MSYQNNIEELEKKLCKLQGFKIQQEIGSFKDSIEILNLNFRDLDAHILNLKNFAPNTFNNNPNLQTKRLVHNYLCSAVTLIDHTRVYLANIHKEKEFSDHKSKIEATFAQSPLCCFVKEFRQYLQHFRLPEISFQSNALSLKRYWSIKIRIDELQKFSGWKSNASKFIKQHISDIDLHKVLREYQTTVTEFYDWLLYRQSEIFSDEFNEVENIKIEIRNLKKKILVTDIILQKFKKREEFEKCFFKIFDLEDFENFAEQNTDDQINMFSDLLQVDLALKPAIYAELKKLN